jgi:photosystem II PsbT protein
MKALVYTFLFVSTLGIIFFPIFFRESPNVPTKKMKWFSIILIEVMSLPILGGSLRQLVSCSFIA